MDNTKLGSLIRALRREAGLTQRELAEALGVTDKAVSKWERGLGCPRRVLSAPAVPALWSGPGKAAPGGSGPQ